MAWDEHSLGSGQTLAWVTALSLHSLWDHSHVKTSLDSKGCSET